MVKIYLSLIKKGLKTIEDVPERIRADVHKLIEENSQKEA